MVTVTGEELRQFWRCVGRRFLDRRSGVSQEYWLCSEMGGCRAISFQSKFESVIRRERAKQRLTWNEIGRMTGLGMREIQGHGTGKIGFRRHVIDRLATALESRDLSRLSCSDIYWDRIVEIEAAGSRETYDLQIEGDHNFLANHFVVHNSHAASFALLVYTSAWLKHYEPAAFCAALINSQPMGFYAPAQLVRDARAHGVRSARRSTVRAATGIARSSGGAMAGRHCVWVCGW